MTVQALRLRNLSSAEAQVRERLGAGLCLNLTQPAPTSLHLRLAPTAFNSEPATALESVCGRFWLDDAEPTAECDVRMPGDPCRPTDCQHAMLLVLAAVQPVSGP